MNINSNLIEHLEDIYNSHGSFEKFPKAEHNGRKDTKKISDKSLRNKEKENRKQRKNGKWDLISSFETLMEGAY